MHVHTSVARLNLVIARRSVPTSLHCYWFLIVGTTFVHLESVHTWVARLNLVNDQELDYRLKGIFDLKSIFGYQHPNMRSILHLLNLWQLANREYWYSRKINCQYFLQTCLHWPPSNYFLFFMESEQTLNVKPRFETNPLAEIHFGSVSNLQSDKTEVRRYFFYPMFDPHPHCTSRWEWTVWKEMLRKPFHCIGWNGWDWDVAVTISVSY